MHKLELKNLRKKFGKVIAVDGISLGVKKGELIVLLGPSGCGKTTTLRCIAGLTRPDEGEIILDGKVLSSSTEMIPPHKRDLSMVFQSYALWPHKTVFENIAYGLKLKKLAPNLIKTKVKEVLSLLRIPKLEERYPSELSGGQQQRIAVARALALEPSLLLFDEPLSNLDAALREEMRFEIRSLQERLGITSVYVTHDQKEAMAIGDRLVVMKDGKIMETGTPQQIYTASQSRFVASFIGVTNIISGSFIRRCEESLADFDSELGGPILVHFPNFYANNFESGQKVFLSVRPECICCEPAEAKQKRPNMFTGEVVGCSYLGDVVDIKVKLNDKIIRVQAPGGKIFRAHEKVTIYFDPKDCKLLLKK